ncbi:MAG: STAS domain-containing protein [Desulfobacterales bacterium]|nr:STAS domain-containing protein [Desulfobacterales bacterium]
MENLTKRYEPGRAKSVNVSSRTVLTPERSITHENCPDIKQSILAAIEADKTEVILDCKNVGLLDSAALELLLQTHNELRSKRGALKIIGLNQVCQDILAATRLNNVILIYKDIHEAIRNIS